MRRRPCRQQQRECTRRDLRLSPFFLAFGSAETESADPPPIMQVWGFSAHRRVPRPSQFRRSNDHAHDFFNFGLIRLSHVVLVGSLWPLVNRERPLHCCQRVRLSAVAPVWAFSTHSHPHPHQHCGPYLPPFYVSFLCNSERWRRRETTCSRRGALAGLGAAVVKALKATPTPAASAPPRLRGPYLSPRQAPIVCPPP